ncbi:MAG: pyrroline-5-carboxylate reductase [Eubacteriaceae bacterium]
MNKIIGIIGCGNMSQAMIRGIVESKVVLDKNIYVSDTNKEVLTKIQELYGINVSTDNKKIAQESDILIFAVKPNILEKIILEIKDYLKKDVVIVSIAAGKSIQCIQSILKEDTKIIRTMPNSGVQVGEGMTIICNNDMVNDDDLTNVVGLFNSFGKTDFLEEKYFDAVTAISGSSPACIYILLEALADAAVRAGIPRQKAYKMVAQTVLGSAKTLLETSKHPGELKDMVCSPGGTSIEAVYKLEKGAFRASVFDAMEAAEKKSKSL